MTFATPPGGVVGTTDEELVLELLIELTEETDDEVVEALFTLAEVTDDLMEARTLEA